MASSLSAFPENIPTANALSKISFAALVAGDSCEAARLFTAASDTGIFHLNLRGVADGESLLDDVDEMFSLAEKLREIDGEEREYLRSTSTRKKGGPFGTAYEISANMVIDDDGQNACSECFIVSKDDILSLADHLPTARILNKNRYLLSSYACLSQSILTAILTTLDTLFSTNPSSSANDHRIYASHGDVVCFTVDRLQPAECAEPTLCSHPDNRMALALFFDRPRGLQSLAGSDDALCEHMHPPPGHAVVRLGDALEMLSKSQLSSYPPRGAVTSDQQAGLLRSSVAYIMRPIKSSLCAHN